jgi:protoheme IX farnesyltransferase
VTTETIALQPHPTRVSGALADYWALTKPEINFLIAIATSAGFCLGHQRSDPFPTLLLIDTLVGTLLVASGTAALNQYIERRFDAQMRRTARRPVASGRLKPSAALWFGIGLSIAGSIYLAVAVNALASLLAVLTLLSYLFLYTPLKRRTPLCVLAGAFPGAMPPLIGWAASSGSLSIGSWALYTVLFLWQFPHFMAIAWMYRKDYARAGYIVLPKGRAKVRFVTVQSLLPLLTLVPFSLLATPLARLGLVYSIGALFLGLGFFYCAAQFVGRKSGLSARRLLFASILYLPSLFMLMICSSAG